MRPTNDKVLYEALKEFAKEYVLELKSRISKNGHLATGDLYNSIEAHVIKTAMGTSYTINIKAVDYLKYVDEGRKPGTYPNIGAISKWATLKQIPQTAVFPIAHSIMLNGIKPTNILAKTVNTLQKGRGINNLEKNASNYMEDMISDLILDVNKNKNITIKI